MYERSLILKLNNYGYNDKQIEEVKGFLKDRNQIPDHLDTNAKMKRFYDKWSQFMIKDDKLFYKKLNLEVIPDDERESKMKELYENNITGVSRGITMFYYTICEKYLNIRRMDVSNFLKNQKIYQITRTQHHVINKPILSRNVNERYGIDCIDMTSFAKENGGINNGFKFILTVVDYFSRHVWARKMKTQTTINVTKALKSIVEETKTYPKIIQADNGNEFMNETSKWMKDNDITYIKTNSYSPQSNGLVEGKNRRIREVLRELMIRNNNRNWTNSLEIACENLNTQRNGTTKKTPISIWRPGHEIIHKDKEIVQFHKDRIVNEIKKNTAEKFNVGDLVRVKMGALFSKIRKLIKSNKKKLIVVNYSPDIYEVSSILEKDIKDEKDYRRRTIQYENPRYTLKLNGIEVETEQKMNNPDKERRSKRFFASDLQKVNKDSKNTFLEHFSMKDAMKLNKQDDVINNRIDPLLVQKKNKNQNQNDVVDEIRRENVIEEPVDRLIGREIKKKVKKLGYLTGKVDSFEDPFYTIVYNENERENMKRPMVLKYLVDLENLNPREGLRKRKEVIVGGRIHFLN